MEAKTLAIQLATKVNFTRLQTKMAALEHAGATSGKIHLFEDAHVARDCFFFT
jgi:hypothetical protein